MTGQQQGTATVLLYTRGWIVQCVTSLSLPTLLLPIDCRYKLRQIVIDIRGFFRSRKSERTEAAFLLFADAQSLFSSFRRFKQMVAGFRFLITGFNCQLIPRSRYCAGQLCMLGCWLWRQVR